jgi:hypothetical protein
VTNDPNRTLEILEAALQAWTNPYEAPVDVMALTTASARLLRVVWRANHSGTVPSGLKCFATIQEVATLSPEQRTAYAFLDLWPVTVSQPMARTIGANVYFDAQEAMRKRIAECQPVSDLPGLELVALEHATRFSQWCASLNTGGYWNHTPVKFRILDFQGDPVWDDNDATMIRDRTPSPASYTVTKLVFDWMTPPVMEYLHTQAVEKVTIYSSTPLLSLLQFMGHTMAFLTDPEGYQLPSKEQLTTTAAAVTAAAAAAASTTAAATASATLVTAAIPVIDQNTQPSASLPTTASDSTDGCSHHSINGSGRQGSQNTPTGVAPDEGDGDGVLVRVAKRRRLHKRQRTEQSDTDNGGLGGVIDTTRPVKQQKNSKTQVACTPTDHPPGRVCTNSNGGGSGGMATVASEATASAAEQREFENRSIPATRAGTGIAADAPSDHCEPSCSGAIPPMKQYTTAGTTAVPFLADEVCAKQPGVAHRRVEGLRGKVDRMLTHVFSVGEHLPFVVVCATQASVLGFFDSVDQQVFLNAWTIPEDATDEDVYIILCHEFAHAALNGSPGVHGAEFANVMTKLGMRYNAALERCCQRHV